MFNYNTEIYNKKSAEEVIPYLIQLLNPKSVIDVGCGLGTWLSVFIEHGVKEVVGIDSNNVKNISYIPETKFIKMDLRNPVNLDKKFDLVLCLEVAEHLPEDKTESFVEFLVSLSNFIVFSAAVPGQGGDNHLNEQWPEYWREQFQQFNYVMLDIIRPHFWWNDKIEWWYRQNMFFIVNSKTEDINKFKKNDVILDLIHPEMFKYHKSTTKV